MTSTGGTSWLDLSANIPGLPQARWISRVECSRFDDGTVYLAIDRHRQDDLAPYLFKTVDHGKTYPGALESSEGSAFSPGSSQGAG